MGIRAKIDGSDDLLLVFALEGHLMRLHTIGLMAAFAVGLALPAGAQTMQTTPGKSTVSPPLAQPSTARPGAMATPSSPSLAKPAVTPNSVTPSTGLVDINTASSADLDALPGIGKARAAAIIKNRPYKGKDDLLNRHVLPSNVYNGIKDKVIAKQG